MIFTSLFLLFNSHLLSSFFPWPQSPQSLSLVPKCFFEFHWISPSPSPIWIDCETAGPLVKPLFNYRSPLVYLSGVETQPSRVEVKGEKMRRGRRARGVTERHPLVKECAGRTTQPSLPFLHLTVVQCTFTGIISHLYPQYHWYCAVYCILCRTTAFKRETMEKKVSECFLLTPCHSQLVNLTPNQETNGLDWNCWPTIDK